MRTEITIELNNGKEFKFKNGQYVSFTVDNEWELGILYGNIYDVEGDASDIIVITSDCKNIYKFNDISIVNAYLDITDRIDTMHYIHTYQVGGIPYYYDVNATKQVIFDNGCEINFSLSQNVNRLIFNQFHGYMFFQFLPNNKTNVIIIDNTQYDKKVYNYSDVEIKTYIDSDNKINPVYIIY